MAAASSPNELQISSIEGNSLKGYVQSSQVRSHRNGLEYAVRNPDFLENLRLLVTFTGIDTRTALPILAEIVDARYFANAPKISKWVGIVPSTNQSEYRKRINGKIYKGGNKYLRRAVWLVAQRVL